MFLNVSECIYMPLFYLIHNYQIEYINNIYHQKGYVRMTLKVYKCIPILLIIFSLFIFTGCAPGTNTTVEINNESFSLTELGENIKSDPEAIRQNYLNKEITVTGNVSSIEQESIQFEISENVSFNQTCPFGYIEINEGKTSCLTEIEPNQINLVRGTIEKGDRVQVSGIFSGFLVDDESGTVGICILTCNSEGKQNYSDTDILEITE